MRYIQGSLDHILCYDGNAIDPLVLQGYQLRLGKNSLYQNICFYLAGGPISWNSRKQKSVALSSTEAEYIAACQASKEAIWIRLLLYDLHHTQFNATTILCDNMSCISLSLNPRFHGKSKHIKIQYHFIREKVFSGQVIFQYCSTIEMVADIFTKALPKIKHQKFFSTLNLTKLPRHQP
ncbi:hypothetical protein O6H91_14G081200 [Diphasiastrum complanatum]|uniref:Uncharacterized protein n=1 Tax=Diphasiastrum complanatum TaxID=34168 RepID=A0ACC2BR98_DIPCM|nr:hypothetical protein O6H91_14G081200 [Diphasiastrum complanatum]